MIPSSVVFDQSTLIHMLEYDPVVQDYHAFFALLEWPLVEQWQAQRSTRGRPPHPESAYLKAFLIRLREGFACTTQLRRFLVKHPLLIFDLGFHLHLDANAPYGFDLEHTLPCTSWLREKLRTLDQELLQALLQATVRALQAEIPDLGEVVAFDVKHIYAWVRENNPREAMCDRNSQRASTTRRSRLPRGCQTLDQPGAARWLRQRKERIPVGLWLRSRGSHRSRLR
jgi:hypothetical protein